MRTRYANQWPRSKPLPRVMVETDGVPNFIQDFKLLKDYMVFFLFDGSEIRVDHYDSGINWIAYALNESQNNIPFLNACVIAERKWKVRQ